MAPASIVRTRTTISSFIAQLSVVLCCVVCSDFTADPTRTALGHATLAPNNSHVPIAILVRTLCTGRSRLLSFVRISLGPMPLGCR